MLKSVYGYVLGYMSVMPESEECNERPNATVESCSLIRYFIIVED